LIIILGTLLYESIQNDNHLINKSNISNPLILPMAEMFIEHMYTMAGSFAASTAVWFAIRAGRKTNNYKEKDVEDVTKEEIE
jgi:hypothetical protein